MSSHILRAHDYLSKLGLKLIHVRTEGPDVQLQYTGTHLKPNPRKISFIYESVLTIKSFLNFAQSTVMILPCSVQISKRFNDREANSYANETARDLIWQESQKDNLNRLLYLLTLLDNYTSKQGAIVCFKYWILNTLRPRQDSRHVADDDFKRIFLSENVWISIDISLKFIPKGPIDNIPALAQIMAWCRSGEKPLSEPMVVILPTHTCVTQPQWV